MSRLNKLKHRLINDKEYFVKYSSCTDKLFELKHAEKVPLSEVNMPNHEWYLPHHGVTHARKPDKLRVVFDSSSKYGGISLNDLLLKGPDLTNSLIGVLLRFRKEQVGQLLLSVLMLLQIKLSHYSLRFYLQMTLQYLIYKLTIAISNGKKKSVY